MEHLRTSVIVGAVYCCLTLDIITSAGIVTTHDKQPLNPQRFSRDDVPKIIHMIESNRSELNRSNVFKLFKQLELDSIPYSRYSVKLHDDLAVECSSFGSPVPEISWWRNDEPVVGYETQHINLNDSDGLAWSKVVARLHIQCLRPEDEGIYTCATHSGGQRLNISTFISIERDDPSGDMNASCELKLRGVFHAGAEPWSKAYVANAETLHMQSVGTRAELRCRGGGSPIPQTRWLDSSGNLISFGEKYKTNEEGSLIIEKLHWTDMGEYSCEVENINGKDKISSFVYPLSPG